MPVWEDEHIRKLLSSTDPSAVMEDKYLVQLIFAELALSIMVTFTKDVQNHTQTLDDHKKIIRKPLSPTDPTTKMEDIYSLDQENGHLQQWYLYKRCWKLYIDPK